MSKRSNSARDLTQTTGFVDNLIRQGRLVWRLFNDSRVPIWVKLIPVAGVIYLLSPIDLIPDFLIPGLGELDDVTALLLSLKMFVDLAPVEVVNGHLRDMMSRARRSQPLADEYIEVPYRVVDDDDPTKE